MSEHPVPEISTLIVRLAIYFSNDSSIRDDYIDQVAPFKNHLISPWFCFPDYPW
jgi:hypothetical protein